LSTRSQAALSLSAGSGEGRSEHEVEPGAHAQVVKEEVVDPGAAAEPDRDALVPVKEDCGVGHWVQTTQQID